MEAYGGSAFRGVFANAAVVVAAFLGVFFIASSMATEGFLALVIGLLGYSLAHEQKPYVI
jgi:hypothetical protein